MQDVACLRAMHMLSRSGPAFKQILSMSCKRTMAEDVTPLPKHLANALNMLQDSTMTLTQVISLRPMSRQASYKQPDHADPCQVPSAGRGLLASGDITQGTTVHVERPMICYPSVSKV